MLEDGSIGFKYMCDVERTGDVLVVCLFPVTLNLNRLFWKLIYVLV